MSDTNEIEVCAAVTGAVIDDAVGVPDAPATDGNQPAAHNPETDQPEAHGTDDNQPETRWYVAIVNHNSELKSALRLAQAGYKAYVAAQMEMRRRANGRRVQVNRVVIPSKVFIHCTERQRLQVVTLPYINRFMTNPTARSAGALRSPLVVIPQREMQIMQFMLGQSDTPVDFVPATYAKGTEVEVVRGALKGLRGIISEAPDGSGTLTVCLDLLGSARVSINPIDVAPVK
ncbi:MAG: hypothetical protein K2H21_02295 [Muribaculaceae bacterium]|nr:hypothetical protein [Muribaculaceae bacterium]